MTGAVTASTIIAGIGAAASVYGVVNASKSKGSMPPPPAPLAAPPMPQSPQAAIGGELTRRRAAAAGGIMQNIATGPQGIGDTANITGKKLLGE